MQQPEKKPAIVIANQKAIMARRQEAKTKGEKAMDILRAAMRRNHAKA